jgi:hypothetical protein
MASAPIEIPLRARNGSVVAVTIVDAVDGALAVHTWRLRASGYAGRNVGPRGQQVAEYLHRVILGLRPGDPLEVDHINRNRLDNRRANIRVVTHAQNMQNRGSKPDATSPYRGVSWNTKEQKWDARVRIGSRVYWVGYFDDGLEAAEAVTAERMRLMPFTVEGE